jgi:hypothetical protein
VARINRRRSESTTAQKRVAGSNALASDRIVLASSGMPDLSNADDTNPTSLMPIVFVFSASSDARGRTMAATWAETKDRGSFYSVARETPGTLRRVRFSAGEFWNGVP